MSTSKSTDLSTLVRQRGNIRGRLTTQTQYINTLKLVDCSSLSNAQVIEIKLHLKKCETLYKDFETFQDKIELLCDESEIQEQINTRSTIENQFITAISTLQDILEKLNPVNVKSQLPSQSNESSVKLPTIKLPVFDGSYLKWLEFRDTYLSLIHENASIQDINKFHYLRASLEGSASEVIKSLEFTSINYKIAWDLLCARYDNKRVLINSHLKSLHLINPITTESHKALRNLLDHVNKNMRALKALGIPTEYWDVHIIFIITMKLDATTNMKWEEYLSNCSDNPTLDQFYTFIRNRADVLENAVSRTTNHSESSSNSNSNNHNKKFWNNNNNNSVSKNNKSFDNLKISSPVASELDLPPNIELADPYFYCPAEVDLLLGADIFWDLVGFKRITLGVGRPVLQESQLGWLKFWEIEELNLKINIGTPEERLCESHFQENVKRLSNGRFSVKMPLKEIPEEALGDSFYLAKKHLASRGVVPQRLLVEPLWWEGPSFLKEGSSSWPQTPHSIVELPELKAYVNAAEAPENHFINFKDFSNFNRLKRIFAYVLRFISNIHNKHNKCTGTLQTVEINKALNLLIKFSQGSAIVANVNRQAITIEVSPEKLSCLQAAK
ncbi:hypothetical protein HF086_011430 [Spodoptera exigua]|uniref:Peptidase aspartic putative domain-containing protein n=1 Tax=Spodoptera exigua TaxID=7107 RepID=A0A922SL14_SPOEX|nr:hypothetical protein HF086_011430 [Spodoptera exigua]